VRLWAIAFLLGILGIQQISSLPELTWLFVSLALALTAAYFFFKLENWQGLLIAVSGLAFGFSWAFGHAHWMMGQRLLPQYEGVDIQIEGRVASLPVSPLAANFRQQRVRFDFIPTKIIASKTVALAQFPARIRLSWYRPPVKIVAGEYWHFTVRLKRPYGLSNPGGFQYANWLYQNRIQARGYIRNSVSNQKLKNQRPAYLLLQSLLQFRQAILNKITNHLEVGDNTAFIRHLTQALILGYRSGLTAPQWQIFQRTGTIHLMAISGLHIGLVAGLVYLLVNFLWRWTGVFFGPLFNRACLILPAPQVAAVAALGAAVLYAMLAGFTIPTQRALIMLSVAMLHIIFRRTPLPASKVIAVSLILVLLFDPLAVLAQGFWLSFLAVSLIIFLMRQPSQALDESLELVIKKERTTKQNGVMKKFILIAWVKKMHRGVLQFGRIQWALTIAMFPLVLFFYQSSSLVSPLANFIAIPVMSLAVVPLMFVATLFLFINIALANLLFQLVEFIYGLLWSVLEILSNWQYSTLDFSIGSPLILLSCFLGIALWLSVKGTPMRWLSPIFFLPLLFYTGAKLKNGEALVTVLDVGQGLSVVVQTREHTLVFDTGPRYSPSFDTGRAVVVPYLRQMRRSAIDMLIISHGDNDHIGGLKSIVALMPVQHILTSIPSKVLADLQGNSIDVLACMQGQQWEYDTVKFQILSPLEINKSASGNGHDENNQSCVLKITTDFGQVLITGDIERETESYLYHANSKVLAADVMLVPHHGSNTSSLSGFIQAVSPQYAVFTVGYKNRYHLPNKKVVQRYQQNSQVYLFRTDSTGALSFYLQKGRSLEPISYRQQKKRYWQASALLLK